LYKAALEEVIAFCLSVDHEIYTPSDFGLSEVSQDQLDQLIDDIKDL
jgi:hypothetical protein